MEWSLESNKGKIEYIVVNKYCSDIVISNEVCYSKPEKEIFEITCRMINLKPENCIMIGDKYKVDVEGSINAGMHGNWVILKEKLSYKFQIEELSELIYKSIKFMKTLLKSAEKYRQKNRNMLYFKKGTKEKNLTNT